MGCNCKVGQQLEYLDKHYGMIEKQRHNTTIGETVLSKIKELFVHIIFLPVYLVLLILILFKKKNGSISIKNTFRLKKA